jgi:hypothetical protein
MRIMISYKLYICSFFFGFINIYAQDSVISSGVSFSSSSGSLSYSVGQSVYNLYSVSNGVLLQGVQQPFEIFMNGGVSNTKLEFSVYPNPTSDWLSIDIQNFNNEDIQFELVDVNGRKIISANILTSNSILQLDSFASGFYFINVFENQKHIKTFKIIKK